MGQAARWAVGVGVGGGEHHENYNEAAFLKADSSVVSVFIRGKARGNPATPMASRRAQFPERQG